MSQKQWQTEKKALKKISNLDFKRKNIFGFPDSPNFVIEFLKLTQQLENMGYIIKKHFTSKTKSVSFSIKSIKCWFFIETKFTNESNLKDLFSFLDDNFDNYRNGGYTGSNEWKHDFCNFLKLPMVGDLKYLDPDEGYWFHNELHIKPRRFRVK